MVIDLSMAGSFVLEVRSSLTGLFLGVIANLRIADEAMFDRLWSDVVERGVAGDDISELGLDDSVVTVDVGDDSACLWLVSILFALLRRPFEDWDSLERLGDVLVVCDSGDFSLDDAFLVDDFSGVIGDCGDFRLDEAFAFNDLLDGRGVDVIEWFNAGVDWAPVLDFFFFIVIDLLFYDMLK